MSMHVLIRANQLSRRFEKKANYAERLARLLQGKPAPRIASTVYAVDNVNLEIRRGEVMGLVGESGCGKSTLGRMLAGVIAPSSGAIQVDDALGDEGITHVTGGAQTLRLAHRLKTQMIFQDPMSSLNPRKRVREIIGEAPLVHGMVKRRDLDEYVMSVMKRVGLNPDVRQRYPHQFSGGQRQRISIGRALAVNPDFLICDESIAALDVSIQAQIINLFMTLRRDLALTYLFISHDLGVVEHISDRVAIMYLGRIVETASTPDFFSKPLHPYSVALLGQVPRLSNRKRQFESIQGEIPSPLAPPKGCHFHPRCPRAMPRCSVERPELAMIEKNHWVACHLFMEAK